LAVVAAVNIQAEVLNLASVTEPASGAGASSFIIARATVLAFNIEAEVFGLASVALPASSACASSIVASSTVLAVDIEAGVSGLTRADSFNAGSLSVALAAVHASSSSQKVLGLLSSVFLLTAVSGITEAELEEIAGSLTVAVAVVAASGQKAGFSNGVDGALAASEEVALGAVVTVSANAFAAVAWAIDTAVDIEALVYELAELADEPNRAGAFAVFLIAGSAVLAVNIEAEVSFLAASSSPASSALAFSAGALGAVEALNSVADVSGLSWADAVIASSLSVALAVVVALEISQNVLGLISEVVLLTAVSGVSLAELKKVAGSLTIAVAVVITSGQAGLFNEVKRAAAASEGLAVGAVVTLSAGAFAFIAGSTVAGNSVAEVSGWAVFSEPAGWALADSVKAGSTVLAVNSLA
jgi:hypothetical protein